MGFPCGSVGKESACNVGDLGLITGLGRSPGEGKDYPLQYSGLENSTDSIVHGVAKSWRRLNNLHFLFHFSTCLQNRSRFTDTENKLIVTKGKSGEGQIRKLGLTETQLLYIN